MQDDQDRNGRIDNKAPNDSEENITDDPTNPFAPENLALSNDNLMEGNAEFSAILASIKVRKPSKTEFFRVHPEPDYRVRVGIIDMGFGEGHYLLTPQIAMFMERDAKQVDLVTSVNQHGGVFIWPLTVSSVDRAPSPWTTTARAACEQALTRWVRLQSDMRAGQYNIIVADGNLKEPVWPDKTFPELLELAFGQDRLISLVDHPIVQRLQGRL